MLEIMTPAASRTLVRPLIAVAVSAGHPCPADDHCDELLDLNQHLINHPQHTYFVRVQGESMINAGIHDGDLLIVDRAITPRNDHVVIAHLNGELTVKRIRMEDGVVLLMPENPAYPVITVTADIHFDVWGVVTNVIHALA